jgi:carotenoid cleavage dioxygenase-like enzyme
VFFIGSIVFGNMMPVILGTRSISDQVTFDGSIPMKVLVVDLQTLSLVRTFESSPGAMIHFGNAWEEGDEIVIDGMFTDNFRANQTLTDVFNPDGKFGGGTYMRYRLNMGSGALSAAQVSTTESEFPTFNTDWSGKRNQVTYTACSIKNGADSFFNAIQRITHDGEAQVLELPKGLYGSEPLFATRAGATDEGDGYVLEVVYDA